jgi:hypothetical protein
MEAEMQTKSYFVLQTKWPYLLIDSKKETYIILAHTWNMRGINFRKILPVEHMQQKSYVVLVVKNSLLCTDRN